MCYLATLVPGIEWLSRDVLYTVLRAILESHPPDISDPVDRFRYFSRTQFKHVSGSKPSDGSPFESARESTFDDAPSSLTAYPPGNSLSLCEMCSATLRRISVAGCCQKGRDTVSTA